LNFRGNSSTEESMKPLPENFGHLPDMPAATITWQWLAGRYPGRRISPGTNLRVELGVDSLEWLAIVLELGCSTGVELDEEAIVRIETVRDLLLQVRLDSGQSRSAACAGPLERPEEFLGPGQERLLAPLPRFLRLFARGLTRANRALMGAAFRVRAVGTEQIGKGQRLFAPNHVSYIDPFVLAAVLDSETLERTFWAGWAEAAFHNPLNRFISRVAKTVPIDPRGRVAASLASAAIVLRRGHNLVWFPEGRRSPDGALLPFRPGLGVLLERFDIPVTPVFISGTGEAMPVGRVLPHPGRVTIRFGKPVSRDELEREGLGQSRRERIVSALRARVEELGNVKVER
jgi:long-chain acyl-CoA synthetase